MGRHVNFRSDTEKYTKFKTLYLTWTERAILKSLDIDRNKYYEFFSRAIADDRIEFPIFIRFETTKEPFSKNEDEYGSISTYGRFYQNLPLVTHKSEMARAVEVYKMLIKDI